MRSFVAVVFCVGSLIVCQCATADELDELLAAEPVSVQVEPLASAGDRGPDKNAGQRALLDASANRQHATAAEQSNRRRSLTTPTSDRTTATADTNQATANSAQKAAPATGFSAVPEPSTVAIAALALAYFLVFGRRRHVI
jgi:PEP-CTERM motif